MSELKFEEPPYRRTRKGQGKHAAIAAELKTRPGEWAIVDTFDSPGRAAGLAWAVKNTLTAYEPKGTFEAVARTVNREHRLYVRYVGEPSHE